ncbi:MAG TPA: hypothetical protein PKD12_22380, partial [Nitrospira sp.]|nr:hypothetical protein [Nitrospira sp.]
LETRWLFSVTSRELSGLGRPRPLPQAGAEQIGRQSLGRCDERYGRISPLTRRLPQRSRASRHLFPRTATIY